MFENIELKKSRSVVQDKYFGMGTYSDENKNQYTSRFCSSNKKEPKVKTKDPGIQFFKDLLES